MAEVFGSKFLIKMKFILLLLIAISIKAVGQVDSSCAYVKYNPKIKKYAVWAKTTEDRKTWGFVFNHEGRLRVTTDKNPYFWFLMFDTMKEAESVAISYATHYKNYLANDLSEIRKGFQ